MHGQDVGVEITRVSPAGSVSSLTSREVSPGSYQGSKVSPYGLQKKDSVSSFCLMKAQGAKDKDMESIAEQEVTVSFAGYLFLAYRWASEGF